MIFDRAVIGAGVLLWAGATLLLSSWPRLARPSLTERLRPFNPGAGTAPSLQDRSAGDLFVPLVEGLGARLARLFGVSESVEPRLRRVHSPLSASAFRLRQMALTAGGFVGGALIATAAATPLPISILLVAGAPLLTFLVIEQRLAAQSERWQKAVAGEMPVVSEQLAMLLNAGYSLGAALTRLAERGSGSIARDLEQVVNRVQQGLSEAAALREWAELAKVEQVDRLVSVLTLHSEAQDLGRLVSAEARYARRDLHRRSVELLDRRSQQVWVPVTVATLVPGVILLAVPFLAALQLFANA